MKANYYCIKTSIDEMDIDLVCDWLSATYWANGRSKERMLISFDHSYVIGVFDGEEQVGFARLVTDYSVHAYLADVYVAKEHRGKGLATRMIQALLDEPKLAAVTNWILQTLDAQSVYESLGFRNLDDPTTFMHLKR